MRQGFKKRRGLIGHLLGLTQLGIGQAQDLPLLMMGPLVGATLVVALADSSYLSAFQLYWQKKGFCLSPAGIAPMGGRRKHYKGIHHKDIDGRGSICYNLRRKF